MAALKALVPAPALEPTKYGLLSLGPLASSDSDDQHWTGGFTYESETCSMSLSVRDVCDDGTNQNVYTPGGACQVQEYFPFVIAVDDPRTSFGYEAQDFVGRVERGLDAGQQKALEFEFWTGTIAQAKSYPNRYLASPSAVDLTPAPGTAIKVRYGLALLEQALSNAGFGTRGVIHATAAVASVLPIKDFDGDGRLQTTLGNYVVAGAGYTGSAPNGAMPGTGTYMYATGPVDVRLGQRFVLPDKPVQALRSNVNRFEYRAEEVGAVTWDGCALFGVHVDLSLDYA